MSKIETGWLIEHNDTSQGVRYLTLRHEVSGFWTIDSLLALRFSRKQDADDFRNYFEPIDGEMDKSVEHQWSDPEWVAVAHAMFKAWGAPTHDIPARQDRGLPGGTRAAGELGE